MSFLRPTLQAACLGTAALSGCAGVSPFDFGTSPQPNAITREAPASEFANQTPLASSNNSTGGAEGLLASMRSAGNAVVDALTIKPKVIPAADPISLSTAASPVGSELHFHAARMSESKGNLQSAAEHYQQALQMAPNDSRILLGYAHVLDRQQNYQEAEQQYLRVLELDPNHAAARNDLGMLYGRAGNLEAARQAVEDAVLLQPTNPRYRNNAAIILTDLGRPAEAFQHLAAVHPPEIAHYNLGFLLAQRQLAEPATAHLREALRLNPYMEPAREMLTQLAGSPGPATQQEPSLGQSRLPVAAERRF